ncbi:MAG: RDD family protein, partial [Lacisediminimonas sp.]|nr:RDD family protein [Lacisediminimonas sp.]
ARAWAGVIDLGLLAALAMPLVQVARLMGAGGLQQIGVGALLWLLPSAVAALLFYLAPGSTPGKLAISAVVVDERTGCPPGLAQQLGRSLGLLLSMVPFGLGFLWVAFHPRKQGWHDKLAGTLVVRARRRGEAARLTTRASYPS